jgi:hypothetical protein
MEEELEIDISKHGSMSIRRELGSKGEDLFEILSDICDEKEREILEDFLVTTPKKMIVPNGEHTWCG